MSEPFTIRSAGDIVALPRQEQRRWLGTIPLGQHGASGIVAGPPGLGKSRFVLQAAACQVAGIPFCGLHLDPEPQRTLFIQGENCLARLQRDLAGLASRLTDEQRRKLDEQLFLTTLEKDMDGDITLGGDDTDGNFARIREAIAATNPQVLVVDPWSGCCVDELSSAAIRTTYMALRRACTASANGPVSVVLVCHSKVGVAAAASACGGEALGYVRGNRNLVGIARAVINLRGCEIVREGAVEQGIEVLFAKSSDGVLPGPLAVRLNPETFVYERVLGFDHAAWQATLEKMAAAHTNVTPAAKAAAAADALPALGERVTGMLEERGPTLKEELVGWLIAEGLAASKRSACETLRRLAEVEAVKYWSPKPRQPYRFYTPEQLAEAAG